MFIKALLIKAKSRKKSKFLLTDEWIKMWHIHTMEYYQAIKYKVLIHDTKYINLENAVLSEETQSQKMNYESIYRKYLK